jgi:histidinol phosphatase-like enzyme (inositol monophosphatase family)
MSDILAELDAFLLELNSLSAEVILPLFRAENGLEDKGKDGAFDPVTAADRGAEAAIRRLIEARYPSHGIVGEEYGSDRPDAEFVWVLDPIDGTRAFIAGLPIWTTLIGLRRDGAPTLGSIGQPFTGEVFIGTRAGSRVVSHRGEKPLKTRKGQPLARAIISTTDADGVFDKAEFAAWTALRRASRLARAGCDAYAYAMVASGLMDIDIETHLKCWDIEAAIPVIEGAGGVVRDWTGQRVGPEAGRVIIAGDEALLDEALPILALAG